MKKFFRVALVCALAGATLLYTGCTKDYSEDLSSLQKKVEDQGKSITSLEDQVAALLRAKTELENADTQAQTAIDSLKTRVSALEKEVDTLKSERTRLEGLINKNAGDITKLQDSLKQVDSLIGVIQGQISGINGKIDTIEATIKTHKDSLAALDTELKTMAKKAYVDSEIERVMTEVAKKANSADVDSLVAKLREEIATKADKATVDSLVLDIKAKLADRYTKAEVDSLINDLKTTLQAAIDLKADKTYVDTELAKKADQSWVENQLKLYVTVENFNTVVAQFTGLIQAANKEIQAIKTSLNDLYEFLGVIKDEESGKLKAEATGLIATMQAKIDSLGNELTNTKTELAGVKDTAEAAKEEADAAVAFIGDLNKDGMTLAQYLDNTYYTKTEIDAFLAAVDQHIKDTLAYYLPLAKYVEDSAEIRKSINAIDTAIFDVIKSVNTKLLANDPSAPTFDEKKISDLAGAISALMDTKVDTMTFNAFVEATNARLNQLEEDMGKVLKRVQSLVYVPDYDDNRITLNWAQISRQNYFDTRDLPEGYDALPASFDTAKWNAFYKAVDKQFKENNLAFGPIVVPSDADFMALLQDLINSIVKTAGSMGKLPLIKESYLLKEDDDLELNPGQVRPTEGYRPSEALMRIFMTSPSNAILQVIMFGIRMLDDVDFINEGDYGFETPIVEPSHIKYRIYGQDAVGTAAALAEKFDEVFDFDVVRVKTRSNDANVSLKITDAKADGDVIDFTVVPEGLPNRFWFYTWDMKNYSNPKLHSVYLRDALMAAFGDSEINIEILAYLLKQWVDNGGIDARTFVKSFFGERYARLGETADTAGGDVIEETSGELEGNSEFPAFSVSLVLTQADSSRFITSSYNNVVPAAVSDKIELVIKRGTEDISWDCVDTVKIVYSDLSEKGILENTALFFEKNGETMTDDEIAALNLGDPTARYFASYEHLSAAARQATDFPSPYFKNTADDAASVPAAKVNLTKSRKDGVGSKEYVILRYFVGPAFVETCGYVEVVRDQINITADLGETVENGKATPFTWNYAAEWVRPATETEDAKVLNDAKIDSAYYFVENAALPRYFRDSAVVVIKDAQKMIDSLKNAKNVIYPDDFKRLTPVDTLTQFTFYYGTAGFPETVKLSELKDPDYHGSYAGFKVYPFFEGNELKAHVDSFYFFKPQSTGYDKKTAKGEVLPLTKISYKAVYVIDGALDVNVSGDIIVDDRDRAPITIALPTTKEDFYVNFNIEVSDSLYTGDALSEGVTVTSSFADHHIAKANVTDAFGKVYSKTWTGLSASSYNDNQTTQTRDVLYGYQVPSEQNPAAVDNVPVNYKWVAGMGSNLEGGWAYLQNERIDSMTTTTRSITRNQNSTLEPYKTVTALVRNNTSAHINTEFVASEKKGVEFKTICNFNSRDLRNVDIYPKVDYDFYLTLWYGQDVKVTKSYDINVEDIFNYERINEYVTYTNDENVFTTLQPKWYPDYATTDFTIPVYKYEANKVLLNQHFRIVDVKKDTVCTNLEGKILDGTGETGADYSYLRRRFWLEDATSALVDSIPDSRTLVPTWDGLTGDAWGAKWAVVIKNPINADTQPNGEPNEISYYSMDDPTDVYADLYVVNSNGSFVKLVTRFDKPAAKLIYNTDKSKTETYENYVIKLYDPLKELVVPTDVKEININNSQVTITSIYQFLSMKDKREFELIDPENNGWVKGNVNPSAPYAAMVEGETPNGFENGYTADKVYDLHFSHTMEYITENVSPETKNRISFDSATGLLRYQNDLQTQLAEPIDIKLTINVDYPWGHRDGAVVVRFYNKPVGE